MAARHDETGQVNTLECPGLVREHLRRKFPLMANFVAKVVAQKL
jgi:hypothetical protein